MSTWVLLAVAAQFLSAISVLIDKHIVVRARAIGEPLSYAYFTIIFSAAVGVYAVFGYVSMPDRTLVMLSLLNGALFFSALYNLYSALKLARASDVAPAVGGISAVVTIILSALLIEHDVQGLVIPAVLLASGTAVISHFHFTRAAFAHTVVGGVSFGASIFVAKMVFEHTDFLNGFFWMRTLAVVIALAFLVIPSFRHRIFRSVKQSTHGGWLLVATNKGIAGASSIMFSIAVSLGSVAVVNALNGLQFVFLFLFSILFARYMPRVTSDVAHGGWHTGLGVSLIAIGFAFLALSPL